MLKYYHYLYFIGCVLFMKSCVLTHYIRDNEWLLVQQNIKGNKNIKKQLAQYYQQQSNPTLPLIPISPSIWIYELGKHYHDTTAIKTKIAHIEKNFSNRIGKAKNNQRNIQQLQEKRDKKTGRQTKILRQGHFFMLWGEPPVIYDPKKRKDTENNFRDYLKSKGYFNANVTSEVKKKNKKISITYHVKENKPYTIGLTKLNIPDTAINKLIQAHQGHSLIIKKKNYEQAILAQERERIEALLKDNGYFNSSQEYIFFHVDTTLGNRKVGIETIVHFPKKNIYKAFTLDTVVFVAENNKVKNNHTRSCITYDGIVFNFLNKNYKPKLLAKKITLRPGKLYRKFNTQETQKQLGDLDMFSYVDIAYYTTGNTFVAHIYTDSFKKIQASNEIGFQVSDKLPGVFDNLSLKSRNLLGGLEILTMNTTVSLEGITSTLDKKNVYRSKFSNDISLMFPKFLFPFGHKMQAKLDNISPSTKFLIEYGLERREEYKRHTLKGTVGYPWKNRYDTFYEVTLIDINFINSKKHTAFQTLLNDMQKQGNDLYRAFEPSFVSSVSFKVISNKTLNNGALYSHVMLGLESGGTTQNFFDFQQLIDNRLEFYQYLKFDLDYSKQLPLYSGLALAYHINFGIAKPYGKNHILPYEKYYAIGGSNSIRAWPIRKLGPGAYNPKNKDHSDFERQGETLIQSSIELRQNLIGFLEGAFFIDAGNIWMVSKTNRTDAEFTFNRFYKEVAWGSGLGLRLNFKFLVVRLDMGIKLYDPTKPLQERFLANKITLKKPFGAADQTTFNFAIDYPF